MCVGASSVFDFCCRERSRSFAVCKFNLVSVMIFELTAETLSYVLIKYLKFSSRNMAIAPQDRSPVVEKGL